MTISKQPEGRLRVLSAYDAWGLLESTEIARVGWLGPDGVALAPVNYTVAEGSIWFRTDPGSALGSQCRGQRIAVEVDHVDVAKREGWSVVVTGTAQSVEADDVPDSVDLQVWPAGPRNLYVRVDTAEVSGRRFFGRARHDSTREGAPCSSTS